MIPPRSVARRFAASLALTSLVLGCSTAAAAPVPVLKRSKDADRSGYVIAQGSDSDGLVTGWIDGVSNPAQEWYRDRYSTLVLDDGNDWPTVWAPRNWHPSPWVYRKSTAYLSDLGVHTNPSYAPFFLKTTAGQPVALDYGCSASGCDQPLLDVTNPQARRFWLYGPDDVVASPSSGDCHAWLAVHKLDGLLDQLSCRTGPNAYGPNASGNFKGAWLDDVLVDLRTSSDATSESSVRIMANGDPIPNSAVYTEIGRTQAAWENGVVALLTELRQGIATLRAQGVLTASQGKVAINYKWHAGGFGPGAQSALQNIITPTTAAGRAILAADYVELENGWIDGEKRNPETGAVGGGVRPGKLDMQWSFERRRLFVDRVHALGRSVIEEKTNSADMLEYENASCLGDLHTQDAARNSAHYASAQYNLAATLVNWTPGDMVGDICELYGKNSVTGAEYGRGWDGYQSDLGAPVAISPTPATPVDYAPLTVGTQVLPGGILERRFTNGRVLVAPPGVSGTVALGGTFHARIGEQALRPVTSVTLTERQGVVLLNTNCSATACPPATVTKTWNLTGKLVIPTLLKTEAPITGTLTTTQSGSAVTTTYTFNDTNARAVSTSATPVTVKLGLVSSGSSNLLGYTPVYQGTMQRIRIKVKEAKMYGAIPIELGNSCQSQQLSDFAWTGNLPAAGGAIESTFSMSNLNGCTALNGYVSPLTASTGNTLKLTVTPNP